MKSLIISLLLLVYPQVSFAGVDAWRMNQFTGKPDYYQTGVDSTTMSALAVSTTALAAQGNALSVSTAALAVRTTALEVSTAALDSTLAAEILVRQALSTNVAVDTTTLNTEKVPYTGATGDVNLGAYRLTSASATHTALNLGGVERTSWPGGASLADYNIWQSSNVFNSILMSSGTYGSGDTLDATGAASKFFFYPKRSAIRAGRVTDTKWDDANIGNYSIGMGYQAHTSGEGSVNLGYGNTVYSQYGGNFAGSGNVVGSAGTGANSVAIGGTSNHANDTAGASGATVGGNALSVETDWGVCVGGSNNAVNGGGSSSVSLGGESLVVSGAKSGAGGESVQNAADHSFAWGKYVGLSDAADGSMLFGYDSSSVKTYTESGKFYIHGLDLLVSSSTTAAVKYGLTKNGAATFGSINVGGSASLTGPTTISTATITGYIDSGMVSVSSSCYVPMGVPTNCIATCSAGLYVVSGGSSNDSYVPPFSSYRYSATAWIIQTYHAATNSTVTVSAYCGRIK